MAGILEEGPIRKWLREWQEKRPISRQVSSTSEKLETAWKMINDAINFYALGLSRDEVEELAKRLNAKAEWLLGLEKPKRL